MELTQLKHLPRAWKRGTDFLGTRLRDHVRGR